MEWCEECGFEYELGGALDAGAEIIEAAAELGSLLLIESADDLRRRPASEVWSPLEYACHVRDVLLVQRERILLARRTERPELVAMGRDERVEHDGYADQQPADVARQMADAARLFANVLARLDGDDWERTVMYGYPAPAERSLRWVAVHTQHELQHHLLDIRHQLV